MTGSWLCLLLLLVGALLLGQPAWGAEEELQQAESGEGGKWHCCRGPARELTSDEIQEQKESSNRRMLQNDPYMRDYIKAKITDYFNAQNPKHFYKAHEDVHLKFKDAPGFITEFVMYMVKTNCTMDKDFRQLLGRSRNFDYISEESSAELSECHPLSGEEEEIQRCTFSMYFSGEGEWHQHHIVGHRCRKVQIVEESED